MKDVESIVIYLIIGLFTDILFFNISCNHHGYNIMNIVYCYDVGGIYIINILK